MAEKGEEIACHVNSPARGLSLTKAARQCVSWLPEKTDTGALRLVEQRNRGWTNRYSERKSLSNRNFWRFACCRVREGGRRAGWRGQRIDKQSTSSDPVPRLGG